MIKPLNNSIDIKALEASLASELEERLELSYLLFNDCSINTSGNSNGYAHSSDSSKGITRTCDGYEPPICPCDEYIPEPPCHDFSSHHCPING